MSRRARIFLDLYEQGFFPMADERGRLQACCFDPRGVLPVDEFHVPRRLRRWLKQNPYRITSDQAFEQVIDGCGERATTWISREIKAAFLDLHQAGVAHSLEAWRGVELVGGLYGLALGATFSGESMFYRADGASKACLVELERRLRAGGFALLDCQSVTPTLAQFGARLVPFEEFFARFRAGRERACRWDV